MEDRIKDTYQKAVTALKGDKNYKWLTGILAAVALAAGLSDLGSFSHGVLTWLNTHFDRMGVWIAYGLGWDVQITQLVLIYMAILPFWISGLLQQFIFKQKQPDGVLDYLLSIFCTWFLWAVFLVKIFVVLVNDPKMPASDLHMMVLIATIMAGITCLLSFVAFGILRGLAKLPGYPAYILATLLPFALLFGYISYKGASLMQAQHVVFYRTPETLISAIMSFIEFFLPALIALNPARVRLVGLLLMAICGLAFGYDYLLHLITTI